MRESPSSSARTTTSDLLPRDRLTGALTQSSKALVLLAAPPGFGKTTLLQQWRELDERPFAWVSVERADDEPVVLWTRIVEALRAVEPGFEGAAQIALHAPQADVLGTVVPLLAHDLRFVQAELVLVLDDYQNVRDPACHESLGLFLSWLPPNVTLVLSTRADPPIIPLGTMRTRRKLLELRAVDLSFTDEEEAGFLNGTLGLGLAPESLAVLHERTEGWPAGVYLASLSLQTAEDPAAFVAGFDGSHRHVVDYLTEVALDSLDPRRRRFLLDTSVLDSFSAPLAEAVTGQADSADLLEDLERANLFLVSLDERREWFRYHQLFADLLEAQLLRHERDRLPTLHRHAAAWYAGEPGRTADAVRHAVAAGDLGSACDLVAERWVPRLDHGEARTTLRWLDLLPADAVAADARLALARAWAERVANHAAQERVALESAHGGAPGSFPDGTSLPAAARLVEAFLPRGDAGAMLAAAEAADGLAAELGPDWRPLAPLALGWARYLAGAWSEAESALEEAAAAARETNERLHLAIANALLGYVAHATGDRERGEARARAALDALEADGSSDPLAFGLASVALGATLSPAKAGESERLLDRGLASLRIHAEPLLVAEALLALAPVRRALRGTQAGRRAVVEARELLEGCEDAGMLSERLEEVARTLTPGYRKANGNGELTERELEVLRYLAEGLPKRDIGTVLFLSYNTIHSHTKSIYQKLRVSSREDALEKAWQLGLLDPEPSESSGGRG